MAQRTSFFNWGLCRSWLRRCWPLWAGYLALGLFIALTQSVPSPRGYIIPAEYAAEVNCDIVDAGISMARLSILVGIAAVMVMYSYMYSSRACGMVGALPVRRETVFTTAFVTGLVPLLLADVIIIGAIWTVYARTGVAEAKSVLTALGLAVMGLTAFYGFAVFCAVLTGSLAVLPTLYFVLGFPASVVDSCVCFLLEMLVYGFSSDAPYVTVLSPIVALLSELGVDRDSYVQSGTLAVDGVGLLAAYCAAGLALAVCALLIYRRREMERAGDVVAVPLLKPIFKYCMTFGCALVLAICPNAFAGGINVHSGTAQALVLLALMLLGAFVGYFASEMLMQKTLRVFHGHWRGFAVPCAVLAALTLAAETDVIGYERRTPDPDDVTSVYLSNYDTLISQPENIAAFVAYHEELIAQKQENESAEDKAWLRIVYTLRGGEQMCRLYDISDDTESRIDPTSNIRRLDAVLNTQEAVDFRIDFAHGRAVTPESIEYAWINGGYTDESGEWRDINVQLTPEQAAQLYNDCIVPDSKDSHLGHMWTVTDDEYFDTVSCLTLDITLREERSSDSDYATHCYAYIDLTMDAARSAAWLEENTELTLISMRDADPANAETRNIHTMPTV